ncbi:hypothetical protein ACFL6Y_11905 [Elusimicrobiota bacterium]
MKHREILLYITILLLVGVFVAPSLLRGAWIEATLKLLILPAAIIITGMPERSS